MNADRKLSLLVPVELMRAYGWTFRRLEQPGSDWHLNEDVEEWLQLYARDWRLQDHHYFMNNMEVHEVCNTMRDAWQYTQPHLNFTHPDQTIIFKLMWFP